MQKTVHAKSSAPQTPPTTALQRTVSHDLRNWRETKGQFTGASTTETGDQSHHLAMSRDGRVVRDVSRQIRMRGTTRGGPQAYHSVPKGKGPTHRHKAPRPRHTIRRADNTDPKNSPEGPNTPRLWGMSVIGKQISAFTLPWLHPQFCSLLMQQSP